MIVYITLDAAVTMIPSLEKTPILIVRFTAKATQDLVSTVQEHIQQFNLIVVAREESPLLPCAHVRFCEGRVIVLGITSTLAELEHEAQARGFVKKR